MKQEYVITVIIGLFLAAYVLEAVVQPLGLALPTPYHYITAENLRTYPFTTTIIVIRAIAIFLSPILFMSFVGKRYGLKSILSLIIAALTQLYVLQELATGAQLLPLEWSLSISLAGLAFLPMIILYFLRAGLSSAHEKLSEGKTEVKTETEE